MTQVPIVELIAIAIGVTLVIGIALIVLHQLEVEWDRIEAFCTQASDGELYNSSRINCTCYEGKPLCAYEYAIMNIH